MKKDTKYYKVKAKLEKAKARVVKKYPKTAGSEFGLSPFSSGMFGGGGGFDSGEPRTRKKKGRSGGNSEWGFSSEVY